MVFIRLYAAGVGGKKSATGGSDARYEAIVSSRFGLLPDPSKVLLSYTGMTGKYRYKKGLKKPRISASKFEVWCCHRS